MDWSNIIIAFIPATFSFLGVVWQVRKTNRKIEKGEQCLLRSQILSIYYQNKAQKQIARYERENLDDLFEAYKVLEGDGMIDDIYEKMRDWDII